ncbi:hypothetical protein WMY93_031341 [Mugilogobius chulae]|uniref:PH domain-containing protein n=1 Tax=Mugilogobius chulae TaxID=88201 RepID=A0AAW0MEV4_9GOBI
MWTRGTSVLTGIELTIAVIHLPGLGLMSAQEERGAQLVLDLSKYERCEELKKDKSRSKKSHSRFTLLRGNHTANTVHTLVFLALSPEEKESWIQTLNSAINRAKTRPRDPVLDQVALEDGALLHPTKERVRIPLGRRLPSRGHLLAVTCKR